MPKKTPRHQPRISRQERVRQLRTRIIGVGALLAVLIISLVGLRIISSGRRTSSVKKEKTVSSESAQAETQLTEESADSDTAQEDTAGSDTDTPSPVASYDKDEPTTITVSVIGDCILGTDEYFDYDSSLTNYYYMYGADYFFQNVRDIFEADDLTIANMEGTLTESEEREDKTFAFKGSAEMAQILTSGGVETCNTANNHSHDYGEQSYLDTLDALEAVGLTHFGYDDVITMDVKGVKVGLTGIYELDDHLEREAQLRANMQKLKDEKSDLIIVIFHWGNELEEAPDSNQTTLGRLAVDLGADLVCGHHPHILQGIETYKGKKIVYSLGNFCFGGNTHPTEFDTAIYQQTFTITRQGVEPNLITNIIPCCVSSNWDYNDYIPTPQEGYERDRIMEKIDERSSYIEPATV
ncbi:MAG: CapA family protein [Blautia sp.]|nr:CapA family protein [Blautia sp.]